MSWSYFYLAEFDLALATIEKYEQLAPPNTKSNGPSFPSSATISELLCCKNAGNAAFKGGKYREAVKHYSDAIMRSIESKSFTAICLCNRAAALHALGEVTDAIADCNLAIALDGDYVKAISRRAKLHEKIRDYEHAAIDFQRLISLLEKKGERKYLDDLTKEVFTSIHKDANMLFKIIGKAYAVLSDTNKRLNYNLQDSMRDDFGWSYDE
ncbi:dnaJ homolog subfamily C member 7 homolog [Bidens hawaiensis]|uniref:dnaJ homolog subfamily C member 7 homolog n=1 Tax=Bidens hawaiensis TaxID=980011 RepID=UPI00404B29C9